MVSNVTEVWRMNLTIKSIKAAITDWYLTRKTGVPKATRDYWDWFDSTVVYNSSTARDMFRNFEYVIHVDYYKIFDTWHPFGLPLVNDAYQYFWPQKPIGECCVYRILRGSTSKYDDDFHITDFGHEDRVYVATNNKHDAVMLALKYG